MTSISTRGMQTLGVLIMLFSCVFAGKNSAWERNGTPCATELDEICGMQYPNSYQGIFDARLCLWANRDQLTPACTDYILHQSPSIIEPCFKQVMTYCRGVAPGENRIHNCLMTKAQSELSEQCRAVLQHDQTVGQEEEGPILDVQDHSSEEIEEPAPLISPKADLTAEYTYIMEHARAKIENRERVVAQLSDLFVFQEVLGQLAKSKALQSVAGFILHVNEEIGQLENRIFSLLNVPKPSDEQDNNNEDFEDDDSDDDLRAEESEEDDFSEYTSRDRSGSGDRWPRNNDDPFDSTVSDDVDLADSGEIESEGDDMMLMEVAKKLSPEEVGRAVNTDDYFTFEKQVHAKTSDMLLTWLERTQMALMETSQKYFWLFSAETKEEQEIKEQAASNKVTWEDNLHADLQHLRGSKQHALPKDQIAEDIIEALAETPESEEGDDVDISEEEGEDIEAVLQAAQIQDLVEEDADNSADLSSVNSNHQLFEEQDSVPSPLTSWLQHMTLPMRGGQRKNAMTRPSVSLRGTPQRS